MFKAMEGAFTAPEHLSPARQALLAAGSATLRALLREQEDDCHNALRALVLLTDKNQLAVGIEGFVRLYARVPKVVAVLCRAPYRDINATCMALGAGVDSVNEKSEKVWFVLRDLQRELSGSSRRHGMAINFAGFVAMLGCLFARIKHREAVNAHKNATALWARNVGRVGANALLGTVPGTADELRAMAVPAPRVMDAPAPRTAGADPGAAAAAAAAAADELRAMAVPAPRAMAVSAPRAMAVPAPRAMAVSAPRADLGATLPPSQPRASGFKRMAAAMAVPQSFPGEVLSSFQQLMRDATACNARRHPSRHASC